MYGEEQQVQVLEQPRWSWVKFTPLTWCWAYQLYHFNQHSSSNVGLNLDKADAWNEW